MSSVAKRHGRWYSVTLKFSCSFFSCDASKTCGARHAHAQEQPPRLTQRGLFKRAICSTIPGWGYNKFEHSAAKLIQRHVRGWTTRRFFDVIDAVNRQMAQQRLKLQQKD